ncbi:DNAJC9 family DNAJ domain-containing protein [Schizosaccharomyces cryophilus OY26]|uniref:DNAJC9 family DNAJ domain-containing protein n=1 Tax=Schizosaccharomyces cryophilus (strain OY26 / ATCC MYA-4695 / CBS 11777 / NBRC 106824 / NRRL Y48691) TaxID=653667 RepID=S9X355_SCHCR|nr:DNAJC9 family DNAJ domain-containing protein [Schizosaccharomyces cryophilus OY26]EPY51532.1 DNAJC9 family DNAJ domain-containing protein [Schizosaccharomyces cryophilus OY26]
MYIDKCGFANHLILLTMDMDPYEVLGVQKNAKNEEIRRAYRKKALQFHPDRIRDEEKKKSARTEFDKVALAYGVLNDEKKRKHFDTTGSINLSEDGLEFDWKEWLDEMYSGVVSGDALTEFKASYQNSEEEKKDVLEAYKRRKGSMDGILEEVMCSEISDEERFRSMIDEAISQGIVPKYKRYKPNEKARKKRVRASEKEAQEAEELAKELGLDEKLNKRKKTDESGEEALGALIRSRQKNRMDDMITALENKYGEPKSQSKSKSKSKKVEKEK